VAGTWWSKAPGTIAVVALLCAVFAAEAALGAVGGDRPLSRLGAFPNDGLVHGQWWRVATHAFLHSTWWQLLASAGLLGWAGSLVEARVGTARWAAIYAAGVIVPGTMLLLVRTVSPREGEAAGASAAVCAVVAAAIVVVGRRPRERRLRPWLWAGLAAALALSFMSGLSLTGHASGLVTGALLGIIFAGL
jgi:rhomboid protease GluP